MQLAQSLLAEFETQALVTRRFIERLPEDRLMWKPHPKSMTAGQLGYHLASVPGGIVQLVCNNPAQARNAFIFPQPSSLREILEKFDESIATVHDLLPKFDDGAMAESWRLVAEGREIFTQPRGVFLRDIMFSHWYQHRGQFSVYLRLLDVPVPSSWGPSADEQPAFMRDLQPA